MRVTFLSSIYFQFCFRIWNQLKILRFLVPILAYLKKKKNSALFCEEQALLYTPLLCDFVSVGRGAEGATFLLKRHVLCPICLTFLVVHFCTHIYVSFLNIWLGLNFNAINLKFSEIVGHEVVYNILNL